MKKILSILLLFSFLLSEEYRDVVYLKNGSIIKGTIVEQIPNKSIKIETADGSVFVYEIDQISKITKEKNINEISTYSYDNMLGGLYLNFDGTSVYAINSIRRISGNVNVGFLWSTYYSDSNLPGQTYQYIPYIGFDIFSTKHFTSLLIAGGVFTIREWSSVNYNWGGVDGSVTHFGPLFGLGLNVKLAKHFGIGFIMALAENFSFTAYSDGSSIITDTAFEFYPAFTVNLYDIFPKKNN